MRGDRVTPASRRARTRRPGRSSSPPRRPAARQARRRGSDASRMASVPSYCCRSSGGHSPPARSSIASAAPRIVAARPTSPLRREDRREAVEHPRHGQLVALPMDDRQRAARQRRGLVEVAELAFDHAQVRRLDPDHELVAGLPGDPDPLGHDLARALEVAAHLERDAEDVQRVGAPARSSRPSVTASARRRSSTARAGSSFRATRADPVRARAWTSAVAGRLRGGQGRREALLGELVAARPEHEVPVVVERRAPAGRRHPRGRARTRHRRRRSAWSPSRTGPARSPGGTHRRVARPPGTSRAPRACPDSGLRRRCRHPSGRRAGCPGRPRRSR